MIDAKLRILIHGGSGRMGQALLRQTPSFADARIVAAVSRVPPAGATDAHWLGESDLSSAPAFDLMIDFSVPDAFAPALDLCLVRGSGFVSGTTGLSQAQFAALDAAAARIAVLWASNFSLGIAVLEDLVRRAAAALPGWDCDLVEAHHVHKRDAPSGTALTLGRAVEAGRGAGPHYASLRAGDIVGEHLVQFAGQGERIELIHRATNRDIFARGALECAMRLRGRGPGRYTIGDLLLGAD